MSSHLYYKRPALHGGATIEISAYGTRKGAPFFDRDASLVELGQSYFEGQVSQGEFVMDDPGEELGVDFPLGHCLVTWTEDGPGYEAWLFRGRIGSDDGQRGTAISDDETEWNVMVEDANIELTGQAFTEPWVRPAETDIERLVALQLYTLNGSSSTATHHRDTCTVIVNTSHLAPNANTVNMPAKKYPAGTQPIDVVRDCGDTAGKMFGVVIHHTGGSSHLCLFYTVNSDHTTFLSPIKISDSLADWDPLDPSAPVYEPHWERGAGTIFEMQTLLSGMVGVWGQQEDGVFVEYGGGSVADNYDYWVEAYHDSVSTTSSQAAARTAGILEGRRMTHVTNRVSVIVQPEQVDLVCAGMSLQIKSVVATPGYIDTYRTLRIGQLRWEARHDGTYWAHMDLERPPLRVAPGRGSVGPIPPVQTVPATATSDWLWTFEEDANDTTDTYGGGPRWAAGYIWASNLQASCGVGSGFGGTIDLVAGDYHFRAIIRSRDGDNKGIRVKGAGGATLGASGTVVGGGATEVTFDFTVGAPDASSGIQFETYGPSSGHNSEIHEAEITHGDVATGIVGTAPPPASTDSTGAIGTSPIYAPADHQHPAQDADVTSVVDEGGFFAGATVEDALQELGGGPKFQEVSLNNRFPIWGHRGDIGSADSLPENTLESLRQCALKGIQGAEIDVRLSSDGTFHLMHDSTVDRTTDGSGAISGKTDAQIAALNVNGGYGYISGSYDVPTLAAVFDALNPYDFMLSIQLNVSSEANATALAEQVLAAGWQWRSVLEVSTIAEATAIKAVSANLTTMVNNSVSGADSSDDVDWLSMERLTIGSLATITGKAPQHVKSYITIDDFPADETTIIQNMWDRGVAAYQSDNLDQSIPLRNALVYGADEAAGDHIADTTDAHDASAISIADAGAYFTGTDVEAALQELGADVAGGGTGSTDHLHVNSVTYSGDGSTTAFELPAAPFDEYAVTAYVSGTRTEVTLSGTFLTTMTFGAAPASATDNIKVDLIAAVA